MLKSSENNKQAPMNAFIKYKSKGDMKIFWSYKTQMPNALDHHYHFKRVTKFVLWNEDVRDHVFSNSFIYFAFYSSTGVNISVRVEFNEDSTVKPFVHSP